jgi:hypothetical protein
VKDWTPKTTLALIAMLATIAGASVLTANRIWLIQILERNGLTAKIGDIAYLDTLIIGLVILSLGIAITPRKLSATKGGFELSGGDAAEAGQKVAASAQETADEISEDAKPPA